MFGSTVGLGVVVAVLQLLLVLLGALHRSKDQQHTSAVHPMPHP